MSADPQPLDARAPEIVVESKSALRTLILNRPEALNALTLGMVRSLASALDQIECDATARCVILKGAGDRGLCAGGDIRTLYQSCLANDGWAETFWREEYALNARIACYPKPYVAFMDGIVMGGGVGISAHAKYRIVTERTKFAMPEVGIGLIPDVGGTWLLSRTPGETGTYLALTGAIVSAADAICAGLADYFIPSHRLHAIEAGIAALPVPAQDAHKAVTVFLDSMSETPATNLLETHREAIDHSFSADTVEAILQRLDAARTPFAQQTAAQMRTKSPTSLKLALKLLRLSRHATCLEECLTRELGVMLHATTHHDVVEGIRAAVIDKDRSPKWQPARLSEVTESQISSYIEVPPLKPIPFHRPGSNP